jgi:Tfp pilus assembly protein PilF
LRTRISPAVARLYRQARHERTRSLPDPDGYGAAELYEQTLRAEPRFAEALSGLADIWVQRAGASQPPVRTQAVAKSRDYARRALALQPDNVEALAALGLLALQYDWDLTAAEEALRAAVASDPEDVDAHDNLCGVLAARGEFDAAIQEYEAARALDPIDFDLHPSEGMLLLRARRYEEASAVYREILRFRESKYAWWGLLWASIKRKDWNEAEATLRPMLELPPRPRGARAGEREFRDLYRRLEPLVRTLRDRGEFDHYHVAAYYSQRGDLDRTFAALDRAFVTRSPLLANLMVDPRFDAIRNDPRYPALAARIR